MSAKPKAAGSSTTNKPTPSPPALRRTSIGELSLAEIYDKVEFAPRLDIVREI